MAVKRAARANMSARAKRLAEELRTRVEMTYGILSLSSGPLYRSGLKSCASNLHSGGVCVRVDSRGAVRVRVRAILAYRVRAIPVALGIRDQVTVLLKGTSLHLERLEISFEGVGSRNG